MSRANISTANIEQDGCDARHLLIEAPTSERIERHANELLSRALNQRPPVAFIGAGASMAYGRISWRDAVIAMQDDVLKRADRILETSHKGDPRSCRSLRELLKRVEIKPGYQVDTRDFLVTFQLSEQLDKALDSLDPNKNERNFRQRLKDLLRDDLGHAQHIVNSALRESPLDENQTRELNLRRTLSAENIANEMDIRSSAFFKRMKERIAAQLEMNGDSIGRAVLGQLAAFVDVAPGAFLKPYHRFTIGAALQLVDPGARRDCLSWGRCGGPIWAAECTPAADILPLERDPLRLLRQSEISRFLTTNYDQELDRRLRLEGLVPDGKPHEKTDTCDLLARRWRAQIFDRDRVGQMLAFAARDGRRLVEVMHLHGRADEDNNIIVTNDDYQKHYLSIDDQRAGMDEALSAAFGGNAVLFVGSGMGEDDLLRPLRQFVGDSVPGTRRQAIAIVPADKPGGDRACELEKLSNLQRYGVYTIHTGSTDLDGALADSESTVPARWLTRVAELRRRLDDVFRPNSKVPQQQACSAVNEWMKIAFAQQELSIPQTLEGVSIGDCGGLELKPEIGLINCALRVAEEIQRNPPAAGLGDTRWARSLLVALEGCMDSIVGAFLCARLLRMKRDRMEYRRNWLALPQTESPAEVVRRTLNRRKQEPVDFALPLWLRHASFLSPPPTTAERPGGAHCSHRFYEGAPSQTFNHLLECLSENPPLSLQKPPPGRRMFVFIDRRGVGKGHFFAMLSHRIMLERFRRAIGNPCDGAVDSEKLRRRWPAAFFNCGLSHEVTSVFDQLSEVLLGAVDRIYRDWDVPSDDPRHEKLASLIRAADALNGNRIGRLRQVLEGIGGLLEERQRIIIGLNGLSILFDREGKAKNAQVKRLFQLLSGPECTAAPIDFVLIFGERRLPALFRRSSETRCELIELKRKNPNPATEADLKHRREKIEIVADAEASRYETSEHQSFVHFLAYARASVFVTAHFPSVALVVALDAGLGKLTTRDATALGLDEDHAKRLKVPRMQFTHSVADAIRYDVKRTLEDAGRSGEIDADKPKEQFPRILAYAAVHAAAGSSWEKRVFNRNEREPLETLPIDNPDPEIKARIIPAISHAIDEQLKRMYFASGRSRFGLTVLTGAAYQQLIPAVKHPETCAIDTAIQNCAVFLQSAFTQLEGTPMERRVEVIIDITMAQLAALDRTERPLPGKINYVYLKSGNGRLFEFQRAILWQLAVIGQPVAPEVLACSPLITPFYKVIVCKDKMSPDPAGAFDVWQAVIRECLELLSDRCLVLSVRGHVKGTNRTIPRRYTVHAQLQGYIFRRLHAPFVEYPEADQFALTLFASQPNDVPRLTMEARVDLYRTVAALIGYPGAEVASAPFPSWRPFSAADSTKEQETTLTIHARLMRAALGIVRSVYSLSTIARTVPQSSGHDSAHWRRGVGDDGILELRRSLVHWMIQQSTHHERQIKALAAQVKEQGASGGLSAQGVAEIPKPFYAEELAWLYNEAGVLSYAQGRMADAVAYFDRASAAATRIEPTPAGGIRTHIALNTAQADIERGRLTLAEAALSAILLIEDEVPVILRLASGLLGVADQIRGRYESAKKNFEAALHGSQPEQGRRKPGLIELKGTRAASIVARHYGDLLRSERRLPQAERMLRLSATLAIEGGHEDIRHQTRLALLRVELAKAIKSGSPAPDGYRFHKELDVVEDFASAMGMPRLQCEVDDFRAQLRESDGDLRAAAAVASRGLTIAAANDLRLRKTRFLLRLATIFEKSGKIAECKAVLVEAFDLARDTDYHSARERGQALYAQISQGRAV